MEKYYFLTYQATRINGEISVWNDVINVSPMKFIKDIQEKYSGIMPYYNYAVTFCMEISKEEYEKWKGQF